MTAPTAPTIGRQPEQIYLHNPVADSFEAFILGNAKLREDAAMADAQRLYPEEFAAWVARAADLPHAEAYLDFCQLSGERDLDRVVRPATARGQHVVICGAGPSLAEHAEEWVGTADQVWACNSALTYLVDRGLRCTHGFTVDQTAQMLAEWYSAPDVDYLLASSVHPHLTEYLTRRNRRWRFFHNFLGIQKPPVQRETGEIVPYEDWVYSGLFPPIVRVGSGLNSVTRAIDLAEHLEAAQITVLGADCALRVTSPLGPEVVAGSPDHLRWLRESTVMHADGGHALASGATQLTLVGEIDGRRWDTKADLIISATFLAKLSRISGGRIRLVGDTLPNALLDKDDDYLNRLPCLTTTDGRPVDLLEGRRPLEHGASWLPPAPLADIPKSP